MLVSYLRQNGKPYACIVAVGPGMVGYSVCHHRDVFNKHRAREIAAGRARFPGLIDSNEMAKRVPNYAYDDVYDEVQHMLDRADKYFKN